jgi:hypothetical protein
MYPNLTNGQRAIIVSLCREEARRLGYPHKYHEENRPSWPHKLKQMRVIIEKLQNQY